MAAWTRWRHGRGGRHRRGGGTDEGDNRGWQNEGGGTDEAAQMRCVAWTRGPGRWHEQGVANGGERGGGTDEEGGTDDGMALLGRVMSHPFAVVFRWEPPGPRVLASTCLAWSMHAWLARYIYKPMTAAQKFGQVCPQNIYGMVSCS